MTYVFRSLTSREYGSSPVPKQQFLITRPWQQSFRTAFTGRAPFLHPATFPGGITVNPGDVSRAIEPPDAAAAAGRQRENIAPRRQTVPCNQIKRASFFQIAAPMMTLLFERRNDATVVGGFLIRAYTRSAPGRGTSEASAPIPHFPAEEKPRSACVVHIPLLQ